MEVQFKYNYSDTRVINKHVEDGVTMVGIPRESVNIMTPIIRFESSDILRFNYAYIPELQRYYHIKTITHVRDEVYDVEFFVDVLMSFRSHILRLSVIVDKQSMEHNGDEYIDDSSLVTDNVMFTTVYNYENGFNDTPEYILITAG